MNNKLQDWLNNFTQQQIVVSTEILKLTAMVENLPIEFNAEPKVKSMIKTAQTLIGNKKAEEEERSEFEKIWNDADHPFWSDPQLIECLRQVEKADASKEKIKFSNAEASTSKATQGIDTTQTWEDVNTVMNQCIDVLSDREEERDEVQELEKERAQGAVQETVVGTKDKEPTPPAPTPPAPTTRKKARKSPDLTIPSFKLISSEELDDVETENDDDEEPAVPDSHKEKEVLIGSEEVQESGVAGAMHEEHAGAAAQKDKELAETEKAKENGKGKQLEAAANVVHGPRHKRLGEKFRSPYKSCTVDIFAKRPKEAIVVYNYCNHCTIGGEPLFKHKSLKVSGMELAMDVDIHYKAIDAW